jgi:hypothetical protein
VRGAATEAEVGGDEQWVARTKQLRLDLADYQQSTSALAITTALRKPVGDRGHAEC